MKANRYMYAVVVLTILTTLVIAACGQAPMPTAAPLPPTPTPVTSTATPVPPTSTSTPVATPTTAAATTATATPKPTSTPEPIVAPTSGGLPDLFWGEGNNQAPLGILIEENKDNVQNYAVVSGIVKNTYQQKIVFMGQTQPVWMVSVSFGNQPGGQEIVGEFFLGRDSDIVAKADLSGRRIPGDPGYGSGSVWVKSTPAREVAQALKPGHQYVLQLLLDLNMSLAPANCDQIPTCVFAKNILQFFPYNAQMISRLKGGNVKPSGFGITQYIYFPNF